MKTILLSVKKNKLHNLFLNNSNNNSLCITLIHSGLTMHASILAYMFNLVEEGKISTPLNPGNPVNNQMFIQEYVANLLKSAFPHLQE